MSDQVVKIGHRGSALALVQARWVSLLSSREGIRSDIKVIKTKGDVVQDRFDKMEGKGFFTKEIEDAVLSRDVDLAVHCLKDLPTESPSGFTNWAIMERESPFDLLITKRDIEYCENGAPKIEGLRVGTSSNRRIAALNWCSPGAEFTPIRGNVPTRLAKMVDGDVDALVLAQAGINRLEIDLQPFRTFALRPPHMVPSAGQGALALQTREDTSLDLSGLHHQPTERCTTAERMILHALGGGCQLPLGVYCQKNDDALFEMSVFLGNVEKPTSPLRATLTGNEPTALAESMLREIRKRQN